MAKYNTNDDLDNQYQHPEFNASHKEEADYISPSFKSISHHQNNGDPFIGKFEEAPEYH